MSQTAAVRASQPPIATRAASAATSAKRRALMLTRIAERTVAVNQRVGRAIASRPTAAACARRRGGLCDGGRAGSAVIGRASITGDGDGDGDGAVAAGGSSRAGTRGDAGVTTPPGA